MILILIRVTAEAARNPCPRPHGSPEIRDALETGRGCPMRHPRNETCPYAQLPPKRPVNQISSPSTPTYTIARAGGLINHKNFTSCINHAQCPPPQWCEATCFHRPQPSPLSNQRRERTPLTNHDRGEIVTGDPNDCAEA